MHAPLLDAEIYDQIRETARRFAADVVKPAANDLDRDEAFPADIYRQMGALGLFGITVPEEHGGAGLDTYAYSIVMEELSRGYSSVADQCGLVELIGTLLTRYGTPDQLKRLPDILAGKTRVAYCLTEAEAGSDLSNVRTTARETAEGYVIDGGKLWIHNAPVADLGFVLASTDPAAGHRGMSIFLVDLHGHGVSRGPKEHKMGQRASQVGALTFDGVTVPREALLGPKGRGFHIMMSVLEKGRVGIASLAVGIAQAGLEAALGYARDRRQFGKPILDNQGLQWLLADMVKDIAAARALVERAALLIDHEKPATSASSMAKCFASDMAVAQTANAVQVFGGSGYIRGFEVERLYRDAKITQIYEGTNQIQRTIIARELVKNGA
ncbi:MAG: acyl-CoA dehydrogenase family protein [Bosea sp. (in: a-proteobacteria)]|uniref:acyl-CoA dehydrogenase family protein n=1 Tax=Bosea sp. (in: a-proteobacteria) TaxID=1871050 RepID=UPI003F7B9F29